MWLAQTDATKIPRKRACVLVIAIQAAYSSTRITASYFKLSFLCDVLVVEVFASKSHKSEN